MENFLYHLKKEKDSESRWICKHQKLNSSSLTFKNEKLIKINGKPFQNSNSLASFHKLHKESTNEEIMQLKTYEILKNNVLEILLQF